MEDFEEVSFTSKIYFCAKIFLEMKKKYLPSIDFFVTLLMKVGRILLDFAVVQFPNRGVRNPA